MPKVRVQRKDIPICKGNPFAYDLLGRKDAIETLTESIGNIDGPCIVGLDAPWGAGKTTFLKIWAQYLRNNGFIVIQFNAWETDYSGDPFLALSGEITFVLRSSESPGVKRAGAWIAEGANRLLRQNLPTVLSAAGSAVPIVGPPMGAIVGEIAGRAVADYEKSRNSVHAFSNRLRKAANDLAGSAPYKPLVIMIDELDRCRPSYAIELLEIAKHLFNVENIIFILSVHKEQLAHSLAAIYGDRFDGWAYLRRFFDLDFYLPDANRREFIADSIQATMMRERFNDNQALETFAAFLDASTLTLRPISKTVNHLAMVSASIHGTHPVVNRDFEIATVLTTLRSINYRTFRDLIDGRITYQQIIQGIFSQLRNNGIEDLRARAQFQSVMWFVYCHVNDDKSEWQSLASYESNGSELPHFPNDLEFWSYFDDYCRQYDDLTKSGRRIDYSGIVHRIELLSQEELVGVVSVET